MTRATDPSPLLLARRAEQARIRKERNAKRVFIRTIQNDCGNIYAQNLMRAIPAQRTPQ